MVIPEKPIVIIDVGSREGVHERWAECKHPIKVIGFEPDVEECGALNDAANYKTGPIESYFYPYALSGQREKRTLYLYKDRRLSSFYLPNMKILEQYPLDRLLSSNAFSIDKQIEMNCIPLDAFCSDNQIEDADFIKLDTQGSELEILQGGGGILEKIFGVEVEVEFVPIYEKQPLFAEVDQFLRGKGFELFDLRRHWWKRDVPREISSRGQMIFADALYFRNILTRNHGDTYLSNLTDYPDKIQRMIVTYSLCGYSDYAFQLIEYFRTSCLVSDELCNVWLSKYISTVGKKTEKYDGKLFGLKRIFANIFGHREETPPVALSRDITKNRYFDDDDSRDSR